ncbi:MAG TPA: serine/threonine-protein kinase [Kofleriaceae bacterium]|nr:serine/threonine-protein kinase [Kofleriaceae bacterium]
MHDSHDLSGVVLDGRYRVEARLAEGAMGAVYRGERVGLGREVAIKVMHAILPGELSARERFAREAELMAKLAHPHCVSVIDFGVHDDRPYLVMELVRGTSLHELIASELHLPVRRAAGIARQILAGLAHAHALGIVHRDIKPANIMVGTKEGLGDYVQILDFGLARLRESNAQLTAGIAVGTPSYMAPEQCRGAPADARVDIYACGVVMFEMLAGRKPFVATDPIAIVKKHLTEAPPALADLLGEPCALEPIVARALAKAPDDRFASAIEMAAAIDRIVPPPRAATPLPVPLDADETVTLGSSAIVPVDEPAPAPPVPPVPPASQATAPVDPHELSLLRRMLPRSRMKWAALLLLLLAAAAIYGIVYAKHYLAIRAS